MARKSDTDTGPSARQLRVGEELRHVLAWVIERGELRDPALVGVSITVTEVRISPDLKRATAYVMPLGGRDADQVVAALDRAASFLRRLVAREVSLRYTPVLVFRVDPTFAAADRIDSLLRDAGVVAYAPGDGDDDGDGSDADADDRAAPDATDGAAGSNDHEDPSGSDPDRKA